MWKKNIWKAVQPQPTAVMEKLVTDTKYDDLFSRIKSLLMIKPITKNDDL